MSTFSFAPAPQVAVTTQTVQSPATPEAIYAAALRCNVFGDDRDALLARWNLLQSSWGCGKLYYNNACPPLSVDQSNPICRFKAMGYSVLPRSDDGDAGTEVSIVLKMKLSQLEPLKEQFVSTLHQVLGGRPNVKVNLETMRSQGQDSTEVVVYVTESTNLGATRRVPASELHAFLTQPATASNLQQKLNVEKVLRKTSFTPKQIQEYYDRPPMGIDPRLWAQAQMDNPEPTRLIPVPLLGFKELQSRLKSQENQARQQQERVKAMGGILLDLKKRHEHATAKTLDVKGKHFELAHRVLSLIVRQETTRKLGFAIQYDEEKIGAKLESLQSQLSVPTQFKGRISELLSQVRFINNSAGAGMLSSNGEKYSVESFVQCDIQNLLRQQQDGIAALVEMTKRDLIDLQQMSQ